MIRIVRSISLLVLILAGPGASGQSFDYHREESPAISWNGVAYLDGRMLAVGGVSLLASRAFAAAVNPALAVEQENLSLGLSYAALSHDAFQYWGVNQGVLRSGGAVTDQDHGLAGLSLSFPLGRLRVSGGWYLSNFLLLPDLEYREDYEYDQYYEYVGSFSGSESAYFLSVATRLGAKVDLGIKLDYVRGTRNVLTADISHDWFLVDEEWVMKPTEVRQQESHETSFWAPSVGAVFHISPAWSLGATVFLPQDGDAERSIRRSFENQVDGIVISDQQSSSDEHFQPERVSLGAVYRKAPGDPTKTGGLTVAAEATFTNWSSYTYESFSETVPREMRNTVGLGVGVELGARLFAKDSALRFGYRFDPQPVKEPKTALHGVSAGFGMRFGKLSADLSGFYARNGSGGPTQNHYVVNCTVAVDL